MGIYILIILIILFGMSSTRMIKLWLGDEDRSHASQQIRAPSVRMSSKAFNCPAFRKSRDIPRAHSCAKAWKLKAQPGDSEIPGESVPPMMSICLITTTCTGFFLERKKAETWIIPVVLQKHQPLPPRLYCLTTPFRFNVKFTIFMGGIGKKNINKKKALCDIAWLTLPMVFVYGFQTLNNDHHAPWVEKPPLEHHTPTWVLRWRCACHSVGSFRAANLLVGDWLVTKSAFV